MNQKRSVSQINWTYALGEIIIVIIGISIAFSLNRWAENAKDRKTKIQYLQSLVVDIDSEIEHLEENILAFEKKLKSVQQVMPFLYGRQAGRDTAFMKVFRLAEIVHFKPKDVTYKTLINSGDFGLFNDFEFKKQLEDYYSSHEEILLDYQRQNNINEKYFGDFLIYNLDYEKIRQNDFSFLDEKILKNIIQSLMGTYAIAIQVSKDGITRSKQLKQVVNEKIERL